MHEHYQHLVLRTHINTVVRVVPDPADPNDKTYLHSPMTDNRLQKSDPTVVSNQTYADYFISKYPAHIRRILIQLQQTPSERVPLLQVYTLPRDDKIRDMLLNHNIKLKKEVVHVLPQACTPLGESQWYYCRLFLPSVLHRMQALLLAEEARDCIRGLLMTGEVTPAVADRKKQKLPAQPRIMDMLVALTPRVAKECINSERFEMLGDSFLKFISSQELFRAYPHRNQGFLTTVRSRIVSNDNLCQVALARGEVVQYLRLLAWQERSDDQLHHQVSVKYKMVADAIESLTAVYFLAGGVTAGKHFLTSMGVVFAANKEPTSPEAAAKIISTPQEEAGLIFPAHFDDTLRNLIANNSTNSSSVPSTSSNSSIVNATTSRYNDAEIRKLEQVLGYRFRHTRLLQEALSHASLHSSSNERLEFFGDAILDFCVVLQLYKGNEQLQQGELSNFKSLITRNENLARFATYIGLHKYISHNSLALGDVLEAIISETDEPHHKPNPSIFTSATFSTSCSTSSISCYYYPIALNKDYKFSHEVKFLADAFEALIAAIYIDSGDSLDEVHAVIRHLKMIPPDMFGKH